MTTREIYFQSVMSTDLPVGILYWLKQHPRTFDGKTETLKVSIEKLFLKFDRNDYEESIEMMVSTEKLEGFMFWALSPEGRNYMECYCKEFSTSILKGIL
jgi:hypothetical protein